MLRSGQSLPCPIRSRESSSALLYTHLCTDIPRACPISQPSPKQSISIPTLSMFGSSVKSIVRAPSMVGQVRSRISTTTQNTRAQSLKTDPQNPDRFPTNGTQYINPPGRRCRSQLGTCQSGGVLAVQGL